MTTSSISLSSRKIVIASDAFGTFMIMMSCFLAFETFFYSQFLCMGMYWQGKKSHPIICVDHIASWFGIFPLLGKFALIDHARIHTRHF